jgi:hypothetical protein
LAFLTQRVVVVGERFDLLAGSDGTFPPGRTWTDDVMIAPGPLVVSARMPNDSALKLGIGAGVGVSVGIATGVGRTLALGDSIWT